MNRLDRISALLVQLQSRPVVRASEMAQRFGVSLRTIYRDMHTLTEAGVPICGDSGIGYSLVDGYKLPSLMFTKEEAMAFLTAEKLSSKSPIPRTAYISVREWIRSERHCGQSTRIIFTKWVMPSQYIKAAMHGKVYPISCR